MRYAVICSPLLVIETVLKRKQEISVQFILLKSFNTVKLFKVNNFWNYHLSLRLCAAL